MAVVVAAHHDVLILRIDILHRRQDILCIARDVRCSIVIKLGLTLIHLANGARALRVRQRALATLELGAEA